MLGRRPRKLSEPGRQCREDGPGGARHANMPTTLLINVPEALNGLGSAASGIGVRVVCTFRVVV